MERKDTFGVHFVLRRMPTGRCYVYARIVVNKTKCELGMKQQINPSDWNEAKGCAKSKSEDNNDRDKILATVASTVIDMVALMEDIAIYAEGSTPARTRLYQIAINTNKEEIEGGLNIYGYADEKWQPFESGKNYEAFLVTRKKG